MQRIRSGVVLVACLGLLLGFGCQNHDVPPAMPTSGYQLTGSVTVNGQPAPAGRISLEPQNTGPSIEAEIRNGQYTTPPENGHYGGVYQVVIEVRNAAGKSLGRPHEETIDFPASDTTRDFQIRK